MNELEICRLLKEEIKDESKKDTINTNKIRMLTEELDKFESLLVTSVDQVNERNQLINYPVMNQNLNNVLPRRNESNSMMDSLMDVANIVLKKSENDSKQNTLNVLFSWYHFLDENMNSFLKTDDVKDKIMKIRDNIFNIITIKMESEVNDMLKDICNKDIILTENILQDDDMLKDICNKDIMKLKMMN